jgi:hypothetical protein
MYKSKRAGVLLLLLGAAIVVGVGLWVTKGGGAVSTARASVPLTELGLRVSVPQDIANLSYRVEQVQAIGPVLFMSTPDLPQGCAVGVFYRLQKSALGPAGSRWTAESVAAATHERQGVPPQAKEFGDFYLIFEPSQAACSSDQAGVERESVVRQKVWGSTQTAELL